MKLLAVLTFVYLVYVASAQTDAPATDVEEVDDGPWTWKTYVKNHLSIWGIKVVKVYEWCDQCAAQTNVDKSLFARMNVRDFPEDRDLKCFWACLADKLNVVMAKKDPVFLNYNALNDILNPTQVGIAKQCLGHYMKGDDNCAEVYETHKCFMWSMDKVHACEAKKAASQDEAESGVATEDDPPSDAPADEPAL